MSRNIYEKTFLLFFLLFFITVRIGAIELRSDDNCVSVRTISSAEGLIIKSTVRGKTFDLKVGITIDDCLYNFAGDVYVSNCRTTKNNYRIYTIRAKSTAVELQLAVMPHAVAFRYVAPQFIKCRVNAESSAVRVNGECKVWYFERKNHWKLKSYAGTWESCSLERLPYVSDKSAVQGPPLLLQYSDGSMAFITEAGLENYSGLRWDCSQSRWMKVDFTEGEKGFLSDIPLVTPWRVVGVVDDLTQLVNQNTIRILVPEPNRSLYSDMSYIVPGKSVWRWFSRNTGSPEQECSFIDYANQLGFRYSIIDEGWEHWDNCWEEVSKLTSYGESLGVKLFLWNHSKNICDPTDNYLTMRRWLDEVMEARVAGVKIDFMNSESKVYIDFDIRLLKECARRKLLVNFHGCQNPSGEQYTYPNELTREGIRGLELNKLEEGPIPAYHNVLLPFTRFVVGHGDYTPLSFTNPGATTFAHQLATLVAFDSPLQVVAEDPELLLNHPLITLALDYIKAVPTVWDETIVLPQTLLGETAVVARRSGKEWYVYALNGTMQKQTIELSLASFLKVKGMKSLSAFVDAIGSAPVRLSQEGHRPSPLAQEPVIPFCREERTLTDRQVLQLAPCGGAVLWLR